MYYRASYLPLNPRGSGRSATDQLAGRRGLTPEIWSAEGAMLAVAEARLPRGLRRACVLVAVNSWYTGSHPNTEVKQERFWTEVWDEVGPTHFCRFFC